MGFSPDVQYVTGEARVAPGDRLLLYTDGLVEARNLTGEFFEADRLRRFVEEHPAPSAERLAAGLLERLADWTGKREVSLDDDLSVVVLDVGQPAAG